MTTTKINVSIPTAEFVILKVHNILGQEVATLVNNGMNAGAYTFNFDGPALSGFYFNTLKAGNFAQKK